MRKDTDQLQRIRFSLLKNIVILPPTVVMAMSTFQKLTLATCLVLCVGLLLPKMLLSRGKRDAADRPEGSGRLPAMMPRTAPSGGGQRAGSSVYSRAQTPETSARAKGGGTGVGTSGKSNLAGQIIPVYGFGILFYILYILFKITSKGSSKPLESRFPSVRHESTKKRKITDFELDQLQEKLRETELVMEKIVSNAHHSPDRVKGVTADQEESLLQQLAEITRVMQEGQLVEDLQPEKKSQEDWGESSDYPEEPQQQYWEHSHCPCPHHGQQHHPGQQPHTDTQAESTQADGADPEKNLPESEALAKDSVSECDFTAENVEEEDDEVKPHSDLGLEDKMADDLTHTEVFGGEIELGTVLQELELSLEVTTSVMEQEKMEDIALTTAAETVTPGNAVRRRNKRRRAKKASN